MNHLPTAAAPLVALPLKPFAAAKARLGSVLPPPARRALVRALAARVAAACLEAGQRPAVVTADAEVASWAQDLGLAVITDPGSGGLNGAAAAVAAAAGREGRPWCVVHADLPLLTPALLAEFVAGLAPGRAVLAPSRQGGTNLLAAAGPLAFAYGPGSFSRHLHAARHLERRVFARLGTALDLDTPEDLGDAAALPGGAWLRDYLT